MASIRPRKIRVILVAVQLGRQDYLFSKPRTTDMPAVCQVYPRAGAIRIDLTIMGEVDRLCRLARPEKVPRSPVSHPQRCVMRAQQATQRCVELEPSTATNGGFIGQSDHRGDVALKHLHLRTACQRLQVSRKLNPIWWTDQAAARSICSGVPKA